MATATEVRRLTDAYRRRQVSKASKVAALVAAYYARGVIFDDEASVDDWLSLVVGLVLRERDAIAVDAAEFGDALRRLEVPGALPFTFAVEPGSDAEQIRRSLLVVGPEAQKRAIADVKARSMPSTPAARRAEETMRRALEKRIEKDTVTKVTGSVLRHAQSGGRRTLQRNGERDRVALGYVRVTRAEPCFFCAMLASRGRVFSEDSFDASDPRFTGGGDAKVHDSCRCTLKPVYTDSDPYLDAAAKFEDMWREWAISGEDGMLVNFRRGYEGREHLIK